jgi:hypothetical protein
MVTRLDILDAAQSLRAHKAGGRPSPHKPIVLLVALGRLAAGHERLMAFSDVKDTINEALVAAGCPKHAHQPFWRLLSSSPLLWEMPERDRRRVEQTDSGDATISSLGSAHAGFPEATANALRDPGTFDKLVSLLAEQLPSAARAQVLEIARVSPSKTPLIDRRGTRDRSAPSPEPPAERDDEGEDPELAEFVEGETKRRFILHRKREWRLRRAKIEEVLRRTGALRCEVPDCDFDFQTVYGPHGEGFAIVHHRTPLTALKEASVVEKKDLAIVCANCHAMIHKGGACRELSEVRPRRPRR